MKQICAIQLGIYGEETKLKMYEDDLKDLLYQLFTAPDDCWYERPVSYISSKDGTISVFSMCPDEVSGLSFLGYAGADEDV